MKAPTHIAFGLLSAVTVSRYLGLPLSLPSLLLVFLGSLLPDIDTDGMIARPGQLLKKFLPNIFVVILDGVGLAISAPFRAFSKHRGVTHWPFFPLLGLVFATMLDSPELFFFCLAYLSHIVADALTVGGVPIFAPWTKRTISLLRIRAGSIVEHALSVVLFLACGYYGFALLPQQTREGFQILLGSFRFTRPYVSAMSVEDPDMHEPLLNIGTSAPEQQEIEPTARGRLEEE